jgi:hypothetical protein
MEFLRKVNLVMYTPRFSIFDLIWIVVIGNLVAAYSPWLYLLLLPTTAWSVIMERHLDKE